MAEPFGYQISKSWVATVTTTYRELFNGSDYMRQQADDQLIRIPDKSFMDVVGD